LADDTTKRKKTSKLKIGGSTNRKTSYKWVITIVIWTFIISSILQMFQAGLMTNVNLIIAFIMLFSVVLIGIIFDIVGVASTSASEVPFHSLASRKIRGAKEAVGLIRSADKVSNFCNDVIGDIAGIISGSASSAIVAMLAASGDSDTFVLSIILTALVAAVTVGGKAIGKSIAISKSNTIIFTVGKILSYIKPHKKKKRSKKTEI